MLHDSSNFLCGWFCLLLLFAWLCCCFFFFFQAEDGIRDVAVTGVQTCALPICEWDREVLKVFKLARAGVVPVFGDGTQELSVLYAGDLADALIAAAAAPDAANGLYYAAHPAVTTSRELVRAIGRAVGGGERREPRIVSLPAPLARALLWTIGSLAHLAGRATVLAGDKAAEFLAPAWTCRADALTRDTGWRARVALDDGLRRTVTWYRREGWL